MRKFLSIISKRNGTLIFCHPKFSVLILEFLVGLSQVIVVKHQISWNSVKNVKGYNPRRRRIK